MDVLDGGHVRSLSGDGAVSGDAAGGILRRLPPQRQRLTLPRSHDATESGTVTSTNSPGDLPIAEVLAGYVEFIADG
jgi:hypothetical protein